LIEYHDFSRVDMRVGRIVKVEDSPKAKNPSYKIWVDFGELGVKRSSAQLTKYPQASAYEPSCDRGDQLSP